MKLVTDGERFAIRKFSFFCGYVYYDLANGFWWKDRDYVNQYCWDTEEKTRRAYAYLMSKKKRKEWVVE